MLYVKPLSTQGNRSLSHPEINKRIAAKMDLIMDPDFRKAFMESALATMPEQAFLDKAGRKALAEKRKKQ